MWQFFFQYILSLLAGKFRKICTAFPLATFLAKNLMGHPLKIFWTQTIFRVSSTNLNSPKEHTRFVQKSNKFWLNITRPSHVKLELSNSCWQTRIDVCETTQQHVGKLLAKIETSSIYRQQFANLSLPTRAGQH